MTVNNGPPTKEELALLYPPLYSWNELKRMIATGDLGLLKRHPDLQKRYNLWAQDIVTSHGSIVNYLIDVRIGWADFKGCPPAVEPPYFTSTAPKQYVKILPNDWPYRVPPHIEHHVIWTQLPVFHDDLIDTSIRAQVEVDGLYGFTGQDGNSLPKLEPVNVLVRQSGSHVQAFVLNEWPESLWECAWFVNPPRLQSVKALAHIHVFARRKA